MNNQSTIKPIYTTRGDVGAYLDFPYIFNQLGEWIGWVTEDRQVYSLEGYYVGWLTNEPRILRHRSDSYDHHRLKAPTPPPHVFIPAHVPLAPMLAEITISTIDVLDEEPERLPPVDLGELREDLD